MKWGFALAVCLFLILEQLAEGESLPFSEPESADELPESALIETSKGPFEIRFYRRRAPLSVRNFEYLARKGFYKRTAFHRYVPGFVIQGGRVKGQGVEEVSWTLPPEIDARLRHARGSIGWAQVPAEKNVERRSDGSQFYISLSSQPKLDGFYTIFAQVVAGMRNVEKLRVGDEILRIRFPKKSGSDDRDYTSEFDMSDG